MASRIDKENLGIYIRDIVTRIHTEADVELLNAYRSVFRKETSFFNRSYVAAYLLMQTDAAKSGKFQASRSGAFSDRKARPGDLLHKRKGGKDEGRNDEGRFPLPEEESARLFISIGRNRRVYPREILSLISSRAGTSKDDIGTIRILDNYSFVQVRDTAAAGIIEALNGKPFRGRTLTVNYARSRGEYEAASGEASPGPDQDEGRAGASGGTPGTDAEMQAEIPGIDAEASVDSGREE
ncbi:MAG: DbpA RNA binding domain-containing protein [Spirochaetaceae bacterium]|jgi:hypothetical protein|nr:DbpA RNA binding domain-containing protein [Spirochaetaceae bacterium]